ncbi:hypothetical protein C4D60_Mb11t24240 [Musa balbisiana]|uniref:Uncharacterized protein n=1 Tax=Musa balbisiana TaxID=52838 RepID=A0A4S8J6E2_MUSBA|nr:hypothetical protein C4D60_Mb11t24240 [Musa balbisiana]
MDGESGLPSWFCFEDTQHNSDGSFDELQRKIFIKKKNCNFKYKCTSSLVPLFLKGPSSSLLSIVDTSCYWKLQSEG